MNKNDYLCPPLKNGLMRIDRALDEYRVPFTGLKDGHHVFEFHLGDQFFEAFEYSEIDGADIQVHTELEKSANMLVFNTVLKGSVSVDCDRCTELIRQEVEGEFQLVVKFGPETGSTDEDVLVLGPQEYQVDLSHYFYEYAHLSLPARRVHPDVSQCNQDVLKKLDEMRVESDSESHWIAIKDMEMGDSEPYLDDEEE
jgi:uncharacterized metal-binding protein YceD (DUF177 family)